jgi:hypothetical protein
VLEALLGGLGASFPVLSIRGSKWRVKQGGDERVLLDKNGDPRPSLGLVILHSSPGRSKNYYTDAYKEGDDNPPTCFSNDGVYPDPTAEHPQSKTCALCKHNQYGSYITPQGTKSFACKSSKRLAVIAVEELYRDEPIIGPMLLRVPAASLTKGAGSLQSFSQQAAQLGADPRQLVVRVSFDLESDYPKINFTPKLALPPELYKKAVELSETDLVHQIIMGLGGGVPEDAPKPAQVTDEDDDAGTLPEQGFVLSEEARDEERTKRRKRPLRRPRRSGLPRRPLRRRPLRRRSPPKRQRRRSRRPASRPSKRSSTTCRGCSVTKPHMAD